MQTANTQYNPRIIRHDVQAKHQDKLNRSDQAFMQTFLAEVEPRAFRMAQIATGNREDALDIVQDAMMKLVQKYSGHDRESWRPLFYRILESRIMDFHRRNQVRNRFRSWLHWHDDEDSHVDPIEQQADERPILPEQAVEDAEFSADLDTALNALPIRQQQVFMLRVWEGLDIADTAKAMKCSQSSVKTHYARALEKLKDALKQHHKEYY